MEQQAELLASGSFLELIARKGIKPDGASSRMGAIEVVDLLETICRAGDRTLALARSGQLASERAAALLLELTTCFVAPRAHARRILEIERELRRYSV